MVRFFLIFVILSQYANSQLSEFYTNERNQSLIKSCKVKKVVEFDAFYRFGKAQNKKLSMEYYYNREGKLIKKIEHLGHVVNEYLDGGYNKQTEVNGKEKSIHIYTKNEILLFSDEPDSKTKVTKGSQLKPEELKEYSKTGIYQGKTNFKYDSKGNIVETENYNFSGELTEKKQYLYDDRGNNLKVIKYEGNFFHDSLVNVFNTMNQVIEERMFDKNGKLINSSETSYLPNGSPKMILNFQKEPMITYDYDEQGRCIKENTKLGNDDFNFYLNPSYDNCGLLLNLDYATNSVEPTMKSIYEIQYY